MSGRKVAKREPKAREEIRRAAERAGYSASQAETAVRMAAAAEPDMSPAGMAAWTAKRAAFAALPVALTLGEACNLVGRDLDPRDFQTQVFEVLARDLDILSDLGESGAGGGFEGWCAFQNLCERIKLAGKIAAVIGGGAS